MCKTCHSHETSATAAHNQSPHSHSHHSHGCGCGCPGGEEAPCSCGGEGGSWWREVLPMAVSALLLGLGLLANPFPGAEWAVFVLAYLPVGLPVLKEAWEEVARGDVFNEFTLMIVATIGAFGIGEYPEAVAVMLFYSVGEYFQDRAVGRAQRDIRALVNLRPDTATVVSPAGERTVKKAEEVAVGEEIEALPGERLPLDGELLTSFASFDTAALTGEAEPRTYKAGGEVQAGMIVIGKAVRVRVVRPAAKSALQRILNLVQDAAARKSRTEQFIRRFARIYTPAVMLLALLIAVAPPLAQGGGWSLWLYRALVFLVISCPCALVVSVPLAYFRSIGVASARGILFKGGNYLDAAAKVTHVVFDKTGTLTTGRFAVESVRALPPFSPDTLLATLAAVERGSTHPIARAVAERAKSLDVPQASDIEELPGRGLRANVGGRTVLAGNARLLSEAGIGVDAPADDEGCTVIYCAADGRYAGSVALADQPKEGAAEAVEQLRRTGVKSVAVLSGDRRAVVERLARGLGIDAWHADLMPEGKVERFKEIKQAARGNVAFVGDGVNDAPVIALSDVGFAMGGAGADAAVETADVVIQQDNPQRVADAIRIGRNTRRTAKANIALALGVKAAVMLAGALGMASLWAAVLADTGVALLCVANTYFIRKP